MKKKLIIILGSILIVLIGGIITFFSLYKKAPEYQYSPNELFQEGLAAVELDGKYGFINKNGETVIDFVYDDADSFYYGITIVKSGSKYKMIDKSGKQITTEGYEFLRIDEKSGLVVFRKNGKYGLLSREGELLADAVYDSISNFSEGLAIVKSGTKYGYIDESGKLTIEKNYNSVRDFNEGLAVINLDGKYGFINKKGELIIGNNYDYAESFYQGYAIVVVNTTSGNNYKVIDKNGKVVFTDYDSIQRTKNCFIVNKDGEYSILDKEGSSTTLTKYNEVEIINSGFALDDLYFEMFTASDDKNYYVINESGNVVISMAKEEGQEINVYIDVFNLDVYLGKYVDNNLTLLNNKGQMLNFVCENFLGAIFNGKLVVQKSQKYGVIDFIGNTIIDFNYDGIGLTADGYAIVEVKEKYGIIGLQGNIIAPIQYDFIVINYGM
jgi:hypothetical protein